MNKEDWEVKRFDEVFNLQMGRTPSRSNTKYWENGQHKWISISDIGDEKYVSETKEKISNLAKIESKIYTVPKGTVIMSFKLSIGKVAITTEDMHTNEAIMAFVPKLENQFIIDFIYYYLLGYNWSSSKRAVMGTTLNKASISASKISIPPLPIQTQIVAELGELNAILDKKKKQLEELDILAQATFYDMFGDPVLNDKGWEVKKLNQLAVLKAGKFIKASDIASDNTGLLYKCYGANGLRGYVSAYNHFGTHVLIGRQGALCGNVTLAKGKFYATEHAVVVTPLIKSESLWLLYILDYLNLNRYATGAAQPGLSVNKINNIIIPFPPIVLQYQFAERIEAIEAQKELINQSIKEVQLLFDYTMDKYFN